MSKNVSYDPSTVAELQRLLAEQTQLRAAAAIEKRAEIDKAMAAVAAAQSVVAKLRAELAELDPSTVAPNKSRTRTANPGAVNNASPHRDAILASLTTGNKTTKDLKATLGDDRGSLTDYHLRALESANKIHAVSRGVYALGPNPNAPATPTDSPAPTDTPTA